VNVAFVNYHDFTSNSAIHIGRLADELVEAGWSCAVVVPGDPGTVDLLGGHRFLPLDFRTARANGLGFPDGGPPALVHAWTPREAVRELTEDLCARYRCPYVVHLEDNEDVLTADNLGLSVAQLRAANGEFDAAISANLSHPRRMRRFLAGAAGITVIVDRLLEFQPDGVPAEVVWPAFEPSLFTPAPPDPELKHSLGIHEGEAVLVYPGNAHTSNATEMRSLYLAVAAVNRRGRPLKLVRLGRDYVRFLEPELGAVHEHVIRVPLQPRAEVGRHLRLADVLVQPGRADEFNDYRFPSKLTEFLATGRPVALPPANIGRFLEDGAECVLLRRGDALEIAAVVERLLADDELRARLGEGARAFAERSFSWPASAERLRRLYERALGGTRGEPPPRVDDLGGLVGRYGGRDQPRIGYATARDYCDSADRLPQLAARSRDMKDVQRPWVLKAILGTVPPEARLLEIGAGEPLVAELLVRLGYDVTVVDPYDGRDRGPSDLAELAAAYPSVRFVRGLFPQDAPPGERYDCIYSISVLEHLPAPAIDDTCGAIAELVLDGGYTIHAVDHVQLGLGDADHHDRLGLITRALGLPQSELEAVLERMAADPETYFLSVESHNRWRGTTPYDEFPMRRCVSIQLCVPVGEAR
jgi:glycosyltransferase involved in cell wall biosynthesis